ncbi:phosphatase PAP2 family protein [Candidatus Micrarchaeota archaeon]|nr:phosphatase PAP2 family protein [Candidatus Micrarchaeota archaeon]MBU1681391.1 phosphatase PAP2 family protein [Candidatus Micrarchaeota archaeon]
MASITEFVQSVDIELIKTIGMFLNDSIVYGILLFVLVIIGEKEGKKRGKIILAIVIAVIAGLVIKESMAFDRPCIGEDWCPESYSFPSTHAVAAFTLMTAFIRKKIFPAYLLFALFVSFTRINLGVHLFWDIAAALPVALISYYITLIVIDDEGRN